MTDAYAAKFELFKKFFAAARRPWCVTGERRRRRGVVCREHLNLPLPLLLSRYSFFLVKYMLDQALNCPFEKDQGPSWFLSGSF